MMMPMVVVTIERPVETHSCCRQTCARHGHTGAESPATNKSAADGGSQSATIGYWRALQRVWDAVAVQILTNYHRVHAPIARPVETHCRHGHSGTDSPATNKSAADAASQSATIGYWRALQRVWDAVAVQILTNSQRVHAPIARPVETHSRH